MVKSGLSCLQDVTIGDDCIEAYHVSPHGSDPVSSSFAIRSVPSFSTQHHVPHRQLPESRRASRLAAISATGSPLVLTAGMRPSPNTSSTFPSIASLALRAVSRSRPSARPPRRGRLEKFHVRRLEHVIVSCRCISSLPFRFQTGVGLFAKRQPRPFPPPFLSPPSGSFSDPLSTHDRSRDRGAVVDGELIKGRTNGDDAVYESDFLICANDGVGAWATRPRGHAGCVSAIEPGDGINAADFRSDYGLD